MLDDRQHEHRAGGEVAPGRCGLGGPRVGGRVRNGHHFAGGQPRQQRAIVGQRVLARGARHAGRGPVALDAHDALARIDDAVGDARQAERRAEDLRRDVARLGPFCDSAEPVVQRHQHLVADLVPLALGDVGEHAEHDLARVVGTAQHRAAAGDVADGAAGQLQAVFHVHAFAACQRLQHQLTHPGTVARVDAPEHLRVGGPLVGAEAEDLARARIEAHGMGAQVPVEGAQLRRGDGGLQAGGLVAVARKQARGRRRVGGHGGLDGRSCGVSRRAARPPASGGRPGRTPPSAPAGSAVPAAAPTGPTASPRRARRRTRPPGSCGSRGWWPRE